MSDRSPDPRGDDADPRQASVATSGGGLIAVAMMVMNVAAYAFTMLAARLIGPTAYGAFLAVMNLLLIINVLQLGMQATAARRISADPGHVAQIEREILRVALRASLLLSGFLLLAAPVVDHVLDLDSLATAALTAVAAIPLTMTGAQAGILQGERRWRELGVLYVLVGVPRLVIGLALTLWQPSAFMAFLGVTLGLFAPFLYGHVVLRPARAAGETHERHGFVPTIREAARNSQALFAYFALTNADMLVGRTVLDARDSGLYAAGLIVSRAVLFLPQFVVIVAFPSMSSENGRGQTLARSLALVGGLGGLCVLGTALLPDLALVFAGGEQYKDVKSVLWLFALLGTVMAMLQLLVYSVLARQANRSIYLVWVALLALVVGATGVSTVAGMLTVVLVVDTVLLGAFLALNLATSRRTTSSTAQ